MSVQSQIDRINSIKQRIRTNLVAQGITVPEDTMLEEMAELILSVAGENGNDYVLTEADKAEIASLVIEMLGGNPIFGIVDADNHIILNGDLPDGTYSVKYEMEDGSTVSIGNLVLDTNVYYTVTNNLTQCTNSNSATKAVQGESYSATITAKSGYELKSVTVTMGGSPVTVSGDTISIANVTGNIVITAVAEEKVVEPTYTNFADPTSADWKTGVRLTTDIDHTTSLAGGVTTNYISVQEGDTLEVTGINIADSNSRTAYWFNSTSNSILKASQLASGPALSDVSYDANSLICTIAVNCESNARIRFSGLATGTSDDVVIKIKRNGAYL